MGALAELRTAVADALTAACVDNPEWSVLPATVDALTPPAYMVEWGDPWLDGPATACRYNAVVSVRVVGGRIDADTGLETVESMVEAATAALDHAKLPVRVATPPRDSIIGNVHYLAAFLALAGTVRLGGN